MTRALRGVLGLALTVALAPAARGHGTIPTSNSISFGPGTGGILLGTNFGGIVRSGGEERFICETLVTGEQTSIDVWAWLAGGGVAAIVATGGFIRGVYVADAEACGFVVVPDTERLLMTDLAADPQDGGGFVAVGATTGEAPEARLVRRSATGADVLATAPGAAATWVRAAGPHVYTVFTHDDRHALVHVGPGGTETFDHPREGDVVLRPLGVDPAAPTTLWLVASSADDDVLLRSVDGGETLTPVLTAAARLRGFAIDGADVWVQSAQLGVHRSDDGGATFAPVAGSPHGACLAIGPDGLLYACGVPWQDRMALGVSDDRGATFEAVLPFYDGILGSVACADPTRASACDAELDFLRAYYGFSDPTPDAAPEVVEAAPDGAPEASPEGGAEVVERRGGDDGCAGGALLPSTLLAAALMALVAAVGRGARRAQRARPPVRRLGIRRRLGLALTILTLLVAGSAALALVAHDGLHAELDAIADSERSLRASLELSVAVREMYAHQAHTIILDDRSHVTHYGPTVREAQALILALEGFLHEDPLAHELPAIRAALESLDRGFRDDILPLIGRGDRRALVAAHDRALLRVDEITLAIGRIASVIGQRSEDARGRTDVARDEEQVIHLTLVLLAVLLAIVTGVQLARAVAGPLEALRRGAQRLATGDLDTRVTPVRDDEIGQVALAFNAMATDLAAHEQRLVQSETLASVGRLAAGVAHEVANPLAVILGHARLLERHADPTVAADARRIALETDRCQAIVQGLLDLARPPRLQRVPVELADVVGDVGASLAAAGLDAAVRIEGAATVSADAKKVRQIVWNLLRNAAEAAPGQPIDVRLEASGDHARLRVEDRGPGVSADMAPRLFEPFASSKGGGTGLGLAVSAALARAHGGELAHVGRAAAGGAAFELTLPRVGV